MYIYIYFGKWRGTASECTSRGRMIHDLYAELNSAYKSYIIRPREVHSETGSEHFPIYLGLGAYGHGTCLHSLQFKQNCVTLHSVTQPNPCEFTSMRT